jgi:hypothetical protein
VSGLRGASCCLALDVSPLAVEALADGVLELLARVNATREELLRTLICEVVATVKDDPRRAEVEVLWEGGAHTSLTIRLRPGVEHRRTDEDTVTLIRRLAGHYPDQQIAAILNKQGRRTGAGLPFDQLRVKTVRNKHRIPAALPPNPESRLCTSEQAARELGVANGTIYRWLKEDGCPASRPPRTRPGAYA